MIRGYLRGESTGSGCCFCPVTAVNYMITGKKIVSYRVEQCEFLENIDIKKITNSADAQPEANSYIRDTLIEKLGLNT